jgi:hypothetical protein
LRTPTIAAGVLGHHHKLVAAAAPQHAVDLVHLGERASAFRGDNAVRIKIRVSPRPEVKCEIQIKNIKKIIKSTNLAYFSKMNLE